MGGGSSVAKGPAAKYEGSEPKATPNVVTVKPRTSSDPAPDHGPTVTTVRPAPAHKQAVPEVGVFAKAFDQVFEEATGPTRVQRSEDFGSEATTADEQGSGSLAGGINGQHASVSLGAALRGQPSQRRVPEEMAGGGGAVSSSNRPSSVNGHGPGIQRTGTAHAPIGSVASAEPVQLQGVRTGAADRSSNAGAAGGPGNLQAGQTVWLMKLTASADLNGQEAIILRWDAISSRWVVRLKHTGEDKRIRAANLSTTPPKGGTAAVSGAAAAAIAADGEKELEQALLQSNWSAIYQLFYERFGVESLGKLERGYAVKAAIEMTISIVSKCFALLRSDPNGRLHCTPLHIAALQSSTEAAEVIVRDSPQAVEKTHKASTSALCPLHIAILCGSHAIVELLLDGKANPNVRTLHDVCPLHLAATTSKELCQLLISYAAEPAHRDVMGGSALHYASTFKQQDALEVLLNSSQAQRLAGDGDQKRVTPLHVCCALYCNMQDLAAPMLLLAAGAKPWQADVSGASARDVVPFAQDSNLMQFFERCGDNSKAAAQDWLEELFLARGDGRASEGSDDPWEEGETPREANDSEGALEGTPSPRLNQQLSATFVADKESRAAEANNLMAEELQRLRTELEESQRRCAELEPLAKQLQHSQEKVEMLEQAARNQQQVFQDQRELMDSARSQYQVQLQELKDRHVADKEHWEERHQAMLEVKLREVRQEEQRQAEAQQREAELRLAELQAQLQQVEQDAREVAHRAQLAKTRTLDLKKIEEEEKQQIQQRQELQQLAEQKEAQLSELSAQQQRVAELQRELARLEQICEQERSSAEQATRQAQDFKSAARTLCAKYGIQWNEEAVSGMQALSTIDSQLAQLQMEGTGRDQDVKAMERQIMELKDEVNALRLAKLEADDKCRQLQVEQQQVENSVSAKALQLEAQLKDVELRHSQALDQARSDAEAFQRRAEAAEAHSLSMQPTMDRLTAQFAQLEAQFIEEQQIRKKYHNQIQDMKGTIRVYCRFRPLVPRELQNGDSVVLRKMDAFTVDLQRPAPHNDSRNFQFDSVFGDGSSQDEVFTDCQDLVQSAVDGYNVTIFAYGQTGAGKTHTMYGNSTDPGLAPRSIEALFSVIDREQRRGQKTFAVKAYMIELYKQDIIDLLVEPKQRDQKSLQVKKDAGRGIMFVEGVSERQISGPDELKAVLAEGERRRHTGSTKMNASSSRSHLLLSIIIQATAKDTDQVIYGKITLCDLAGSERPKKSDVSGDALKEAIEINKSLTALGDVIEALSKGAKNIPYRNHKLTMLMQDSLGGSAKTLMFVNCSPGSSNCEETLMSLKWATRAKQVTNDVKRNADSKEVARLKQVIALMSAAQNVQEEPAPASAAEAAPGMVS